MSETFRYCTQCGRQVDPYESSGVEPGNPAGDRPYFCRPCGQEWPAPNIYATGAPCEHCLQLVPSGLRYCGACGRQTPNAWDPPAPESPPTPPAGAQQARLKGERP